MWRGFISVGSGKIAANYEGEAVAVRNKLGNGEVLWIPSLLGLGSRISGDYTSLIRLLKDESGLSLANIPVRFQTSQKNMLMKSMRSGSSVITVIVNKQDNNAQVALDFGGKSPEGKLLYSTNQGKVKGNKIQIASEETMVIEWK
jgi:beta-galactosidase